MSGKTVHEDRVRFSQTHQFAVHLVYWEKDFEPLFTRRVVTHRDKGVGHHDIGVSNSLLRILDQFNLSTRLLRHPFSNVIRRLVGSILSWSSSHHADAGFAAAYQKSVAHIVSIPHPS